MDINSKYAVQMRDVTIAFGKNVALNKVKLNVKKGSIHAILGENGAGKTTLMNILYGLYRANTGNIYLCGKQVEMKNPATAIAHGIGMVHQHFMLVDNFTVTQNIILGKETTTYGGILDMNKAKREVLRIVDKYGLKVEPDAYISDISVAMQQRVEILKALYRGAELLILDEPTAVLTPHEIEELICIMKKLAEDGKTIIIITHKLKEIKKSADYCTIIRRGKYINMVAVEDVSEEKFADMMVGRCVKLNVEKKEANPENIIFEVKNISVKDKRGVYVLKDLSLSIRKGEIMGVAGVDGNGQKEFVEAITNLIKVESGTIKMNGKSIQNKSVRDTLQENISIIHEDRQKRGIIPEFSVAENAVLNTYLKHSFSKRGILNHKNIHTFTSRLTKFYDVRPENCEELSARELSGGNQQKLIIGREIVNNPDLIIAMQPTRGLDVGAIENVHNILIQERDKGKAVLLISFELDEIMNLSDSIAVIYDGTIRCILKQGEADERTIGFMMAGGKMNEKDN